MRISWIPLVAADAEKAPRYVGGQAVMGGVMMRGATKWAVAVRRADGSIDTKSEAAPTWAARYSKIPIVRGAASLGESLSLGFKALTWSAAKQVEDFDLEDTEPDANPYPTERAAATDSPSDATANTTIEQDIATESVSTTALGIAAAVPLVLFTAIFILAPAILMGWLGGLAGLHGMTINVAEGVLRLAMFVAYMWAIAQTSDVRQVFEYHGAEHKAIAAYETGVPLTVTSAQKFSTAHVRCGTNFMLIVMVATIAVYTIIGRHGWLINMGSRILLLPVIAGASYELIRFAARHMRKRWVQVVMKPGLALQRLTTREPSDDQVAVAITSLRAVLDDTQLAEVDARSNNGPKQWVGAAV